MRTKLTTKVIAAMVLLLALVLGACSQADEQAEEPKGQNTDSAQTTETTEALTEPVAKPETPTETATTDETKAPAEEVAAKEDPHEVTVLHAKDDVGVIPVFDEPNGKSITLLDKNEVDGIELEYPLEGRTYYGNRLALLVKEFDATGNWARVLVPVRPNGTTVWVQTAFFTQETHNYRIVVDISDRTVSVYKGDEVLKEGIAAVTGRKSRVTPEFSSYVDEKIPGTDHGAAYGPWILSIAGFSEDLGTFGGGGLPKIAIHGTNKPDLVGQAVSSGCVRITNDMIEYIHDTVPVGTVVDLVP